MVKKKCFMARRAIIVKIIALKMAVGDGGVSAWKHCDIQAACHWHAKS